MVIISIIYTLTCTIFATRFPISLDYTSKREEKASKKKENKKEKRTIIKRALPLSLADLLPSFNIKVG